MTRSLFSVEGNHQRLDGGAMFGNCPKAVWEKWIAPDEKNRIPLSCRAMLVREPSGRHVLCEAGIGAFFEPKMRERFGVDEDDHVLLASLAGLGLKPSDIDVVVLSHLHFDHAGGLLSKWREGQKPELVFDRARYVVGARAWDRAKKPHFRDKASFIPELTGLLEQSGRLEITAGEISEILGEGYSFVISEGHTPGLMLVRVEDTTSGAVTFLGDLVPGTAWVHLPITMGYDRFPELLIEEKRTLLERIAADGSHVFYTHDPAWAASRIKRDETGKFAAIDRIAELHG